MSLAMSRKEREEFLRHKTDGDRDKMNKKHDKYAPLVNRRLEFVFYRDEASADN